MDNAAAGWALMLTGLIETVAVAWVYGIRNFIADIENMIGPRSKFWWAYWVICWGFVTPGTVNKSEFDKNHNFSYTPYHMGLMPFLHVQYAK